MNEKDLTDIQSKIMQAIVTYRNEKGYNPTMREVGEAVGLSSVSSVSYQLSQLRERGYLNKAEAGQRAMDVLKSVSGVVDETGRGLPDNAGTVLRAADAAGADGVLFSDNSVDVYNPKVVRSTTGSLFHVPISTGSDILETIAAAKAAGLQVFAADGGGVALPDLSQDVLAKPTMWVFGNEAWGFEPEVLAAVDRVVAVPIYGAAESLNLATAASICLYATAFAQNR